MRAVVVTEPGGPEVLQIADPRTLYEEPCNTFVANFIGENNRINGTLLASDGKRCQVQLPRGERVEALAVNVGQAGEPPGARAEGRTP